MMFPSGVKLSNYSQSCRQTLAPDFEWGQGVGSTLLCPSSLAVTVTFGVCHAVKRGGRAHE